MDLKKIKVEEIPGAVRDWCEEHTSSTSFTFAAYLEYIDGEIVERIFGSRRYKRDGVKIHEVIRDCTGERNNIIARDLLYTRMAGYRVVFEASDVYNRSCGWAIKVFDKEDFGKWYKPDGNIGCAYTYINSELIFTIPEFKYCGFSGGGVISYLNAYRKDKNVEFFGKLGLSLSPILIHKAKSDGQFRRFLWDNHNAIALYGVQATLHAYKVGCTVEEARRACYVKNQLDRLAANRIPEIKGTSLDRQRVLDYVDFNDINYDSYDDYLKCCKALRLNLADTKVVFPNDFERMHDLRTAEYASQQAKIDRRKRAKLYKAFRIKAQEYKALERNNGRYAIICPSEVSDLMREGEALSHCVGRMGYDKKVADGVSIIMFIRKANKLDDPFVTLEYRIDRKALTQCYGYKDSKPTDDVLEFARRWAYELTERINANERQNITRQAQ
jgi:hypothetical protein